MVGRCVMTPAELHAAVTAAVQARLETARAATPGPWRVSVEGSEGSRISPDYGDLRERSRFIALIGGRVQPEDGYNARHIVANDPDVVIRACEADLQRLADHDPGSDAVAFHWSACPCSAGKVCPELRRFARVYGVEVGT